MTLLVASFSLPSMLVILVCAAALTWVTIRMFNSNKLSKPRPFITELEKLQHQHPVAQSFHAAVHSVGGGTWPPIATHGASWPVALRPYHEIYMTMSAMLAVAKSEISHDDETNCRKIELFRFKFSQLLHDRIDMVNVKATLDRAEANSSDADFPSDAYNGFYACMAMSRHAFRWGIIPVVKAAQNQKLIEFPDALSIPWGYITRRYEVSSMGGNVMSNYLYNLNGSNEVVYEINSTLERPIQLAEHRFTQIFHDLEAQALPVYSGMINAIIAFEKRDFTACLNAVKSVNQTIRYPLSIFYSSLNEAKISRDIWLPYVQGFQGWAAGEMIDGQYVESDGLSGNQLCFFHVVDAFLGLEPYLSRDKVLRYIVGPQRRLVDTIQDHCFRNKLDDCGLDDLKAELDATAKHMRVFRAAHKSRAIPYLKTESPERMVMTAGKSILGGGGRDALGEALRMLTDMLDKRFRQTV